MSLTDVRDRPGLTDYAGELQARTTARITDRPGSESGTVQQVALPVTIPCTPTLDPLVGASCTATTTLDALTPGIVDEGARAVWELGQVEVLDGGPDGDVDTPGNTIFARQGIFIP